MRLLFQELAVHGARRHEKTWPLKRMVDPHSLWITETTWALFREWTHYRLHDATATLELLDLPGPSKQLKAAHELLEAIARSYNRTWLGRASVQDDVLPSARPEERRKAAEDHLRSQVEKLVGGKAATSPAGEPKTAPGPSWLDHYNAACVYLTPATKVDPPDALDEATRVKLMQRVSNAELSKEQAEYAVEELRAAMRRLSPGELWGITPWVCSEDPDLVALRDDPAFARFVARQFPGRIGEVKRPARAHLMELALHTTRAARSAASKLKEEWCRRTAAPVPGAGALERVWFEEDRAWSAVSDVAEHHKDWSTRLRLIHEMNQWVMQHQQSPLHWQHPLFDTKAQRILDEWRAQHGAADGDEGGASQDIRRWVNCSDVRLQRVHRTTRAGSELESLLQAEKPLFVDSDQSLSDHRWHQLAAAHAELWRRMVEWLSDDCLAESSQKTAPDEPCGHHLGFERQVRAAKEIAAESGALASAQFPS